MSQERITQPSFTPGRDDRPMPNRSMKKHVETTAVRTEMRILEPDLLLLRHCFALAGGDDRRPPAKVRLEQAVGPELARRLLTSLTLSGRR
jgi:hypothetical protein